MAREICTGRTIAAGTNWTSQDIILRSGLTSHGIEFNVTGDGTFKVTTYTSISGQYWVKNAIVVTGFGKTSGPDSDGNDNRGLWLIPGDFVRFKLEETGSSNSIIVTMYFAQM